MSMPALEGLNLSPVDRCDLSAPRKVAAPSSVHWLVFRGGRFLGSFILTGGGSFHSALFSCSFQQLRASPTASPSRYSPSTSFRSRAASRQSLYSNRSAPAIRSRGPRPQPSDAPAPGTLSIGPHPDRKSVV